MTAMIHMTSRTKALAVFFGGLVIAAVVTLVAAHSSSREPARAAGELSEQAQATDRPGAPMHVAIVVFAPSHGSSPRIIHIPQADERDSRANAGARDEAVATVADDDAEASPPPRYCVIPLPRHSEAPAPKRHAKAPAPQRQNEIASTPPHGDVPILQKLKVAPKPQANVQPAPPQQDAAAPATQPQAAVPAIPQRRTDVPPPQLGMNPPPAPQASSTAPVKEKLSPVRPTPKFGDKSEADNTTSYGPPVSAHIPPPPPPVGYAPPSGLSYRSN